jgi:hypothetical protein
MHPIREKILFENIREKKDLQAVKIETKNTLFNKKFNGSISYFFRCLKNGLYSFNGVSNRDYFKEISGMYFSLEEGEELEIIIVFDEKSKSLNEIQVKTRIKKLLGIESQIQIGSLAQFEERISEMFGIRRKTQSFGDYYFANQSSLKDGIAN